MHTKVMSRTRKSGRMDARTTAQTLNSHCGDYVSGLKKKMVLPVTSRPDFNRSVLVKKKQFTILTIST